MASGRTITMKGSSRLKAARHLEIPGRSDRVSSLTSPSGEPERLATVILTRTLSGPGTQRGTGVHTNGAPGPNHPRVPRRMANTKNHRWIELFHPISGPAPPRMLRTAVPGLTSLWSANRRGWLRPFYTNKRPSTGAPFAQRRAPGLTIPRDAMGRRMAISKTIRTLQPFH